MLCLVGAGDAEEGLTGRGWRVAEGGHWSVEGVDGRLEGLWARDGGDGERSRGALDGGLGRWLLECLERVGLEGALHGRWVLAGEHVAVGLELLLVAAHLIVHKLELLLELSTAFLKCVCFLTLALS